ncbi:hypothetical protein [Bacillus sp. FJAT-50079]|uniref:hypothetical protein n=1 Tax=Bacillus sp. FJAT-50079 TaxID=2833577 RepID=UPI001BCA42A4|nr:hypothetical protein [Bacillus sp. FJAT-50079]MBS4210307.1 hypothetical protein [Bacillus sp. FJAT-50079]
MYYYLNRFSAQQQPIYLGPYSQYTAPVRYVLTRESALSKERVISQAEVDFISMNRLLWEEHVNWTRMTIISIVFNLPDLPFVQERLLKNATDLGNCLRPFYGDQIADHYAALIKDHLVIAAQLVTAAVKGDTKTATEKEKQWYKNADDITLFLSSINPYLNKDVVRKMFYTHLSLTKNEAVLMIERNYQADVEIFDEIEAEALAMSDLIAEAIVIQFAHMFGY